MVTIIKYCGHVFKTNLINQWFETNVRCPICRYDIRNYREPNATNNTRSLNLEERINTNLRENINSTRRNIINRNLTRNNSNINTNTNTNIYDPSNNFA